MGADAARSVVSRDGAAQTGEERLLREIERPCSAYAFPEGTLDAHRMILSLPTGQPGRRMRNPSGRRRRLV
jgi:hypothetical protein